LLAVKELLARLEMQERRRVQTEVTAHPQLPTPEVEAAAAEVVPMAVPEVPEAMAARALSSSR
jgi:hypothetical protein